VTTELAKSLLSPLLPRWVDPPEGSVCGSCGSKNMERSIIPAGGPWSGTVRCKDCGHSESVASYLGRTCFEVEPMEDSDDET